MKFYDTDSEARWWAGILGRTVLVALAVFVLAAVSMLGVLGWRWAFASPKGKVEKREIIQSGTNQLGQQAQFEQLFADIKAYDVQIIQTHDALSAAPDDQRLQTILLGLKNQCADAVGQYNALARTERAEAFRTTDLPASLDAAVACVEPR